MKKRKKEDPPATAVEPKETEWRSLWVRLTEEEIAERGKRLAAVMVEKINKESLLSVIMGEQKERLKELEAEARGLAKAIASGQEERSVECLVHRDLKSMLYSVTRPDTGEVVYDRQLTEEEEIRLRQQALPGVESAPGTEVTA